MKMNEDFTPEEAKTEEVRPVVEKRNRRKGVDKQAFIARKLKAINLMTNEAKARGLADRVMRNK